MSGGLDAAALLASMPSSAPDLGTAAVVALHPFAVPKRSVVARLRQRGRTVAPFADVVVDPATGVSTVVPHGPGPAVASVTVELLAELGVRSIVTAGVAGWNDPTQIEPTSPSKLFAVDRADGIDSLTSRYSEPPLRADPALLAGAVGRCPGLRVERAHTTATPLRTGDVDGPCLVEMEAAMIYAVASALGVAALSLVVVSDVRDRGGWRRRPDAEVADDVSLAASWARSIAAEAAS